ARTLPRHLDRALRPGRPVAPPAGGQPRRRDARGDPRGGRRRGGLLPAGTAARRGPLHHGVRVLRHDRRRHGPSVRSGEPLRRVPRLDAGPDRRRRDLRRPGDVLRRPRRRAGARRALDLLPDDGVGDLLRPGARRGARDGGQGRHRRARRPARLHPRHHRCGGPRQPARRRPARPVGGPRGAGAAGRREHRHGRAAGPRGPSAGARPDVDRLRSPPL
ncbi:MAG: Phosphatidylinositol phosphate synthase @ Archaetidylinositol phosphate synthase, partial [uncultured Nocardioidaceae bacterium]